MQQIGRLLLILGILLAAVGLLLSLGIGTKWIGRLPGDIRIEKENVRFYFPITTCLLGSLLLSAILWLLRR
ncbi:hypothetical protein MAMC_02085 [Methylacidimicrobium cyclopophantes]|uniref:DUF2905 domain-containing protein n=1 Tax=Methylacidimicrobium cyclopophantes TaxID=1041766 RepID=A0A5E6MFW4_9BACT|nr:DUF2905 domain-containing protein [Methylacidimicrobium cyclopophantes]VVM08375.1 hypothetical protein MAMC_02085 [Methylacidimicrobium cyclopophantes]